MPTGILRICATQVSKYQKCCLRKNFRFLGPDYLPAVPELFHSLLSPSYFTSCYPRVISLLVISELFHFLLSPCYFTSCYLRVISCFPFYSLKRPFKNSYPPHPSHPSPASRFPFTKGRNGFQFEFMNNQKFTGFPRSNYFSIEIQEPVWHS